ncbi:hypothetical protein KFV02_01515 [Desulfohalobiaceae bacterium Ax17]|uniref:hypothetical protein n=1 Tax=Desulfovulcanus ferrireducens TaxID=2831190 RepID=UPI00207BC59A|nr:hypothetical protein [Desulfovulcanus ferrireducens]MBT8762610.1 hypothetical protein [Desulfovulcanus ferrireducens]
MKRIFLLLGIYFYLLICLSVPAFGEISPQILSMFKEEIESARNICNLEILNSSYAKFNFIGGFADGKYKLKRYKIKYIQGHIYQLNLVFEKKKGILKYGQKVNMFFWYFRNKIVFLTPKGKRKFILPDKAIKIEKTATGYKVITSSQATNIELPLTNGKIYLKLMVR